MSTIQRDTLKGVSHANQLDSAKQKQAEEKRTQAQENRAKAEDRNALKQSVTSALSKALDTTTSANQALSKANENLSSKDQVDHADLTSTVHTGKPSPITQDDNSVQTAQSKDLSVSKSADEITPDEQAADVPEDVHVVAIDSFAPGNIDATGKGLMHGEVVATQLERQGITVDRVNVGLKEDGSKLNTEQLADRLHDVIDAAKSGVQIDGVVLSAEMNVLDGKTRTETLQNQTIADIRESFGTLNAMGIATVVAAGNEQKENLFGQLPDQPVDPTTGKPQGALAVVEAYHFDKIQNPLEGPKEVYTGPGNVAAYVGRAGLTGTSFTAPNIGAEMSKMVADGMTPEEALSKLQDKGIAPDTSIAAIYGTKTSVLEGIPARLDTVTTYEGNISQLAENVRQAIYDQRNMAEVQQENPFSSKEATLVAEKSPPGPPMAKPDITPPSPPVAKPDAPEETVAETNPEEEKTDVTVDPNAVNNYEDNISNLAELGREASIAQREEAERAERGKAEAEEQTKEDRGFFAGLAEDQAAADADSTGKTPEPSLPERTLGIGDGFINDPDESLFDAFGQQDWGVKEKSTAEEDEGSDDNNDNASSGGFFSGIADAIGSFFSGSDDAPTGGSFGQSNGFGESGGTTGSMGGNADGSGGSSSSGPSSGLGGTYGGGFGRGNDAPGDI